MKMDVNHKPIFSKDDRDAQINRFIIAVRNKTFLTKKQRVDRANGIAIKYSKSQKQDLAIVSAVEIKVNALVGSFWILKTWDNYRVIPYGKHLKWSRDYLISYAICNGIDNMMALNFGRVIYMQGVIDPPHRPDTISYSGTIIGNSGYIVQFAIEGDGLWDAINKPKPVLKLLGVGSLNLHLKETATHDKVKVKVIIIKPPLSTPSVIYLPSSTDKIRIDTITPPVDNQQTNSLTKLSYVCKQCGGTIAIKSGVKRLSGGRSYQQYKCSKCNGIQRDDNLICTQQLQNE